MDYQCEILINAKLEKVVNAFMSHQALLSWQTNLKRIVALEEANAYLLIFGVNGEEFAMKRTLAAENLPDSVTHVYEVPGARNERTDYFMEEGDTIVWIAEVSFHFEKQPPVPDQLFEAKILSDMDKFKHYVESH